jgi:hypothetical protein
MLAEITSHFQPSRGDGGWYEECYIWRALRVLAVPSNAASSEAKGSGSATVKDCKHDVGNLQAEMRAVLLHYRQEP